MPVSTQADVGLGERLGATRREGRAPSAAERPAARSDDHWHGRVAELARHALEAADRSVKLVPLAVLGLDEEEGKVRAGAEVGRLGADDQPVVALRGERDRAVEEVERIEADDVELAMELDAQDPPGKLEDARGRRRQLLRPAADGRGTRTCPGAPARSSTCGRDGSRTAALGLPTRIRCFSTLIVGPDPGSQRSRVRQAAATSATRRSELSPAEGARRARRRPAAESPAGVAGPIRPGPPRRRAK
jgi:hypothetical protein